MSPSVRAKIIAAADYLKVAPTVVKVVRDLDLPPFDARITAFSPDEDAEFERLATEWGLGTAMSRVVAALQSRVQ
jgi:hypothetical protein